MVRGWKWYQHRSETASWLFISHLAVSDGVVVFGSDQKDRVTTPKVLKYDQKGELLWSGQCVGRMIATPGLSSGVKEHPVETVEWLDLTISTE